MRRRRELIPLVQGLARGFPEMERLRSSLFLALSNVPTERKLKAEGGLADKADRERLRQRRMLKVALDFVRNNLLPEPAEEIDEDGNLCLEWTDDPQQRAFSDLSFAAREFSLEIERLDAGLQAQTILSPPRIERERGDEKPVTPQRKVLLNTLLYVEFLPTGVTKTAHRAEAAVLSGYTAGTLKTKESHLAATLRSPRRNSTNTPRHFTKPECRHYRELRKALEKIDRSGGRDAALDFQRVIVSWLANIQEEIDPRPRRGRRDRAK